MVKEWLTGKAKTDPIREGKTWLTEISLISFRAWTRHSLGSSMKKSNSISWPKVPLNYIEMPMKSENSVKRGWVILVVCVFHTSVISRSHDWSLGSRVPSERLVNSQSRRCEIWVGGLKEWSTVPPVNSWEGSINIVKFPFKLFNVIVFSE